MTTQYHSIPLPTITLVAQYKRYANRGHISPRLARVLSAIAEELQWRAKQALANS